MADARSLLAIHAHPDDETITMGGTLARYSAEGVRTIVVTCTTGDLGAIGGQERARPPEEVAMIRASELDAAVRRLGVSRLVQLGYGDSGMPGTPENSRPDGFFAADLDEAANRLLTILSEERPMVMVAYDETGGYGHPDHIKAHRVAVTAYARCAAEVRPKRLYFVCFPRTWAREFTWALREAGIEAPSSAATGANAGPDVTELGVPDDLITTGIDVRNYVPVKLAALSCHASQMPPGHFLRRMPLELARRLWAYEFYSRAAPTPFRESGLSEAATTHDVEEAPRARASQPPTTHSVEGGRRAVDPVRLETDLFAGL